MKKLSDSLTESRFVDLINKKFTDELRKEDTILTGNLQKLKPVDIGTSVLWADNDLCVGGEYLFTFDDVTDMLKNSEWRLPTVSEVKELKECKKYIRYGKYIFTNNGTSLTFYPHGYIDVFEESEGIQFPDDVKGWTTNKSIIASSNNMKTYIMNPGNFNVSSFSFPAVNKNSLLSARLVKDK